MEKLKIGDRIYLVIDKRIKTVYEVLRLTKTTAIAYERYFGELWSSARFRLNIDEFGECRQYHELTACDKNIKYYLETPELKKHYEIQVNKGDNNV